MTCTMVAQKGRTRTICSRMLLVIFTLIPTFAAADEGGISLWLPGQFGSLAAAPQKPGWSLANIYYHTSVSAGGDVAVARQFTTRAFTRTATANLNASLNAHADLDFVSVNRVFETSVLGGQLAVGVTSAAGYNSTSINGTLTTSIGNLAATRTGSSSDARGGIADLYPLASLRWNDGVNNFMVYMMGDIPVGAYDPARLANIGIGHGAIDGGVGYTYLDPQTGHELSVVTGLTGNFANPDTHYQNGMDWHLDWGASQFLTKQLHIGAVGYVYKQISPDSGAPAILGSNELQVLGLVHRLGTCFRLAACRDI